MSGFKDLKFKPWREASGKTARYHFPNGYGVSVVSHAYSYGGPEGFYELAVLDANGDLLYDTPVTDDVVGWLDPDGVTKLMEQVAALPSKQS